MKLHLEATPQELVEKGEKLVESIRDLLKPASPDLAEALEKAIPRKEAELKFPVLQELQKKTEAAYEKQMELMLKDIGKVLDKLVKKSENNSDLEKGGPYIGPRGGKWADAKHTIPWHGEEGSNEHLKVLKDHLQKKFGVSLWVNVVGAELKLSKVVVPKEKRGEGIGSQVMDTIKAYADKYKKTITLSPSTDFGGTKGRLISFYKKHGFVENKGKKKDYEISEAMYRLPGMKKAEDTIEKALYIGPRGGRWADAKHTIPYKDDVPKEQLIEAAHEVIKKEVVEAAHRAVNAGANVKTLRYLDAGGEGIIFEDGKGRIYKVARFGKDRKKLRDEAEAMQSLKGTSAEKYIPEVHKYDVDMDVIVRDKVEGSPGNWGTKGLREAYDTIASELKKKEWTAPEYKENSFIVENDSIKMIDMGFVHPVGKRSAKRVGELLEIAKPDDIDLLDTGFEIKELLREKAISLDIAKQWAKRIVDLKGTGLEINQFIEGLEFTGRNIGLLKEGESILEKALYIGPRGGRWADAKHTIPYKEDEPKKGAQLNLDFTPKPVPPATEKQKEQVEKDRKKPEQVSLWGNKITPEMIKQIKKDMRVMSKLYRNIDIPDIREMSGELYENWRKESEEVRKTFRTFTDNLQEWGYDRLLPEKDTSYAADQVKKTFWMVSYEMSSMFPERYDYSDEKHKPSPWGMEKDGPKALKRMQGRVRQALQAAERYIADAGGEIERAKATHVFNQDGVNYVVHTRSLDGDKKKYLEKSLNTVHRAHRDLKELGLGRAMEGLTVHVHAERPITIAGKVKEGGTADDMVAGWYNPAYDKLRMFPLGYAGDEHNTLVHEIGHRVYFKLLSTNAVKQWENTVNKNSMELTNEHIDSFIKDVVVKHTYERYGEMVVDKEKVKRVADADTSKMGPAFKVLAREVGFLTDTPADVKEHLEGNSEYIVGRKVNKEFVTEYAETNPAEMFAEIFKIYVNKGPEHVPPWSREQFRSILRSGNIKLTKSEEDSTDYTEDIVEKEEKTYEQIKAELVGRGYTESDFEEGGPLYGYSTNELIDLARDKRED